MSEEDFYVDILKDEEEENSDNNKQPEEYQWGSEPPIEQQPDPYKQEAYQQETYQQEEDPYAQEYYGEGYYQDRPPAGSQPPGKETPWFWIGILIGAGLSAIVLVIFNFTGAAYNPLLGYIELVLLLACTTIPGLFVRKAGKGILGGMMIFAMQFFIPLIVFYATARDFASFFNPYFIFLNALGLLRLGIDDFFSFSFIPIPPEVITTYTEYQQYTNFVWIFDLLIIFGLMITLVVASSWMFSNIFTKKVKTFWTWFLLPAQAIFIILNLVLVPWVLLSLSSGVQTAGALAAGAGNIVEVAAPYAGFGNMTGFDNLDTQHILSQLDKASMWFDIAQSNYLGLNNLLFFRLLEAAAMQYGFVVDVFDKTVSAGFELLAALQPLAHGLLDHENYSDVSVNGFYFQYNEFMGTFDSLVGLFNSTGGGLAPSESELATSEAQVNQIISNIEYLIDNYFQEVLEHIVNADGILADIDPAQMRDTGGPQVINDALNQVADYLDMAFNITNQYRVLLPLTLDLFDVMPDFLRGLFNMLLGNLRLLFGFQFQQSQYYLTQAAGNFTTVQAVFTPARRTEVSTSEPALGFFDFFNDTLSLISPIIIEEGHMAGTLDRIVRALDVYVDNSTGTPVCDIALTPFNEVFANMTYAASNSTAAVVAGGIAASVLTTMADRSNNSEYSFMSGPATAIVSTLTGAFQPLEFAQVINHMTLSINATFASTYYITQNDETKTPAQLTIASTEIGNAIAICDANPDTPVAALKGFLVAFQTAISDINDAISSYLGGPLDIILAIPAVNPLIIALWEAIHLIVDVDLGT